MSASARIEELKKRYDENPRRFFAPLANEYRKAGDLGQAIALCETHLRDQLGTLNGYVVYGQALFDAGRFDESRSTLESALALDPENLIALRHLGDIARTSGDAAQARTWYMRVLDADPRNHEMLALLAELPAASPPPRATPAPTAPQLQTPTAEMPDVRSAPTAPMPTPVPVASAQAITSGQGTSHVATPTAPLAGATAPPITRSATPVVAQAPANEPAGLLDLPIDLGTSAEGPVADATLAGFGEMDFMFSSPAALLESASVRPTPVAPVDVPIDLLFDENPQEPEAGHFGEASIVGSTADHGSFGDMTAAAVPGHDAAATPVQGTPVASEHQTAAAPGPEAAVSREDNSLTEQPSVQGGVEHYGHVDAAVLDPIPEYTDEEAPLPDQGPVYTPALGMEVVSAVTETPSPFVTETMAELYLQQGFREEGLAVYRQLLEQNPNDPVLRDRVRALEPDEQSALSLVQELEEAPAARATDADNQVAAAPASAARTARQFFGALAARRAVVGATAAQTEFRSVDSAPSTIRPQGSSEGVIRGGSLDALFGDASVGAEDERMALSLADIAEVVEPAPGIKGRPTQPASTELSLDAVFRESSVVIPGLPTLRQSQAGFDDFFSGSSGERATTPADVAAAPPVAMEPHGTAELEQFQDWLQQLKKP